MRGDVVMDTGCWNSDGGDAWCHVSRVSIRDKDNGIHPQPPVLVMTQLSHNIGNPGHFLRVSVILRSGCWENEWTTSSWVDNTGRQKYHELSSDAERKISRKPHSIEFCFPVNWISQNFFSPVRKVISLWDLKITFILIKCISCTGNQFTLSLTNKKGIYKKTGQVKSITVSNCDLRLIGY